MNADAPTMPMGVDSLFVPPDGAIQFVFNEYPNDPIWVDVNLSVIDDPLPGCLCGHGHDVLITGRIKAVAVTTGMHPCVCACWGRIIE